MAANTSLLTVMYHYVRDVAGSEFPNLKALGVDDFRRQVDELQSNFEMATLESALAFIKGEYAPSRPLCLLTFDDGFAEHHHSVTPILKQRNIQGIFFLATSCIADGVVLPVHKNHFLMAHLGFEEYRKLFMETLPRIFPEAETGIDKNLAEQTYRWDEAEVANFKYLINYRLEKRVCDRVLSLLFEDVFGREHDFAASLYLNWAQAREMQKSGMLIGGHTHTHPVLSDCLPEEQRNELQTCFAFLKEKLLHQDSTAFAYPFGKPNTFNETTIELLSALGWTCAFSTEVGVSGKNQFLYTIPRLDPKDLAGTIF